LTTAFFVNKLDIKLIEGSDQMPTSKIVGEVRWRLSDHTCALSDAERHLAHVFECSGKWTAFDATTAARAQNGLKQLGIFHSFEDARCAVEASIERRSMPAVRAAGV
jgi:hypothetical protein